MKASSILTIVLFGFLASPMQATSPAWVKTLSSPKLGSFPKLKPVQLTYQARFNNLNINAGKISFIFDKPDKRYPKYYLSQAWGGSSIKPLPYTFTMTSFASRKTLQPKLLILNEKDHRESDDITNKYSSRSVQHKKTTTSLKTKKKTVKSHTFSAPYVHDFLTTMLYLRSQKLATGDTYTIATQPFSTPYLATIKVLGKEKHLGRDTIKLDVALRKINPTTKALVSYKKMKNATIWITDDALRIPLQFRIKVEVTKLKFDIGSVNLTLVAKQKP